MNHKTNPVCSLCNCTTSLFSEFKQRLYYKCNNCEAILLHPEHYMSFENEEKHYSFHNNDVEDQGYQNFVSPITSGILNSFTKEDFGLDFGAGTGSAISKVLQDNNYQIKQYDPYFHNYPELLNNQYDYIACCEVIEHFHHPAKEFNLLRKLLKPNGKLFCMTHLFDNSINFEQWYYKNDHTHVFMYQKETIEYIAKQFGFSEFSINNRLIIFSN